ncbi:MATE family efflux transporter [Rhizobium puerariae]|uniref:MATE family efflux transporter n=1 Tax=Rhizobium puerariae TaxID=1585791 RepID=A0ABV6AF13_9HYPH
MPDGAAAGKEQAENSARGRLAAMLAVALPMILANLTLPLMALTGTMIAGHFDNPAELAGVTLGASFVTMIYMLFTFLRMSATAVVAQADGADDMELVRDTFVRMTLLAVVLGLVLAAPSGLWVPMLLPFFGSGPDVELKAMQYIGIRLLSAPAALAGVIAAGYLLGRRRAISALVLQAAANLINICCALLLVYGLSGGVDGIAWAAVVAEYAGIALALLLIAGAGFPEAPPLSLRRLIDHRHLLRLGYLGRDLLIRSLALLVSQFLMTRFSAIQGTTILAANAILLHLHTLVGYAIDGFAYATQALVGAAIGARDLRRLRETARAAFELAGVTAFAFALVFLLGGREIVVLLTSHQDIAGMAIRYMPWLILLPFVTLWSYIFDGLFIGSTRVREARDTTLLSVAAFAILVFPAYRLLGNDGLWGSFALLMALRGMLLARIWAGLSWEERLTSGR